MVVPQSRLRGNSERNPGMLAAALNPFLYGDADMCLLLLSGSNLFCIWDDLSSCVEDCFVCWVLSVS